MSEKFSDPVTITVRVSNAAILSGDDSEGVFTAIIGGNDGFKWTFIN